MKKGVRVGVDVGGTLVKLALVDEKGRVLGRRSVSTVKNPRLLVKMLQREVADWFGRSLLGTGIGVAGLVNAEKGLVGFSPNLGWKNVWLAGLFRQANFPTPIIMDNDANAAAWGAFHGEFNGRHKNLITLTLGTGVGGGLVLGGKLYRGTTGSAGEVGHIVVENGGDRCVCGNRGCLESYMGGASLVRWAQRQYRRKGVVVKRLDPKILEDRARAGDPIAKEAYGRGARALGTALTSLVNLLNPDTILLTGGMARGARFFLPEALRVMRRQSYKTPSSVVRVTVAKNPSDLGVIGAALLVE